MIIKSYRIDLKPSSKHSSPHGSFKLPWCNLIQTSTGGILNLTQQVVLSMAKLNSTIQTYHSRNTTVSDSEYIMNRWPCTFRADKKSTWQRGFSKGFNFVRQLTVERSRDHRKHNLGQSLKNRETYLSLCLQQKRINTCIPFLLLRS
jgi:hypothetical protein